MEFAFLTYPELESMRIRWADDVSKTPALIAAALRAGFNECEIGESPVGVLEHDFEAAGFVFKAGATVLTGMNGSTLVEFAHESGNSA